MTTLREIAVHVPPSVPLASLADQLGLSTMDVKVFKRLHGLENVVMADGLTWADQVLAAASGLAGLSADADRVRYLLAARSELPLSHTEPFALREVAAKLGLRDDVICLVVAEHACASALLAIDHAGRLLRRDADPDALALVLAGEKASLPRVQHIPNTTIMAEGSAAILVSGGTADTGGTDRDQVLSYVSRCAEGGVATYEEEYPYVFAATLREAVAAAGRTWDDIVVVLPHNVNTVSWVRVARLLDLPEERIFLDNVPRQAHSFSADSFLNYVDVVAAGRLRPGDHYVMAASGIRTVASAMVLRH